MRLLDKLISSNDIFLQARQRLKGETIRSKEEKDGDKKKLIKKEELQPDNPNESLISDGDTADTTQKQKDSAKKKSK